MASGLVMFFPLLVSGASQNLLNLAQLKWVSATAASPLDPVPPMKQLAPEGRLSGHFRPLAGAAAAYREGDMGAAVATWRSLGATQALVGFGNRARDAGAIDRALEHYGLAMRVAPQTQLPDVKLAAAGALYLAGRWPEAIEAYEDAFSLGARTGEGAYRLGRMLSAAGRNEAAIAALHRALEAHPGYLYYLAELGQLYTSAGQHERAEAALEAALMVHPNNRLLVIKRAANFAEWGRSGDARALLASAAARGLAAPEWAEIGRVYTRLGDHAKAAQAFLAWAALAPANPQAQLDLGLTYERMGDVPQAIAHYEAALQQDAANTFAAARMAALRAAGGIR